MLNSFQIDVSERNSTAPFVQRERCQYTHEGHPSLWFPPVCRCVCLCVSAHSEFSLYRYFSLSLSCMELCSHTHSLTHSHTHTHTHTLQILSSVSKNISNYCFKCSSITECQVSSVTRHTHRQSACTLLSSVRECGCALVCVFVKSDEWNCLCSDQLGNTGIQFRACFRALNSSK